jgi:hypothetical protein
MNNFFLIKEQKEEGYAIILPNRKKIVFNTIEDRGAFSLYLNTLRMLPYHIFIKKAVAHAKKIKNNEIVPQQPNIVQSILDSHSINVESSS